MLFSKFHFHSTQWLTWKIHRKKINIDSSSLFTLTYGVYFRVCVVRKSRVGGMKWFVKYNMLHNEEKTVKF